MAAPERSNDLDEADYSHGVFERDPAVPARRCDAPQGGPGTGS